jgi:PAS domain S-box-containing protein
MFLLFLSITDATAKDISNSLEKITLQLQWKHQFEFAGFYAAKEKGYYKDVGLDVDFLEFNPEKNLVNSVLNGEANYGLSYSKIIADYMQGKPIVLTANFFKQSPLVLITQEYIKTPADLKNKKIMGLLDSSHKNTVLSMLKKFNISKNDFINVPRKFNLQSFIDKKVDAISAFTTNEVYELSKLGIKYNVLDPAAFGIKFYDLNLFTTNSEVINNPKRVENFTRASIRGWKYALENKEEIVELIIAKYNTQNKSKEALLYEAKQIEYLMLKDIYPIGSVDIQRVEMIADNYAQSLSMSKESISNLNNFIYKMTSKALEFTANQKAYLKEKKVIKMCVDPNWMPLEKIENEKHIGIASDFIKIISKKIDTPIELVATQLWSESLDNVKNRKCDILALAAETPIRKKYLDFTTPYIKIPLVVATKASVAFSNNLNSIKEKPLGVVRNYSIYELLKDKYPDINLVEVESLQEGLAFVDQEKIFGFLDNSMVINNEIQKNNMSDNINITGQFKENLYLSIASRNDEPILNEILEIALMSIKPQTSSNIIDKWNNIKYQVKTDNQILIQLIFFALVLIGATFYWNLKLKDEIKSKESAKQLLKESEEKFRTLFDISPVLLNSFDENKKLTLWNKECEKVFGWSFEEISNSEDSLKLFYPNSEIYEKVLNSFESGKYGVFSEWHPKTKDGNSLVVMWANVKLPNGEIINIGYDITYQRQNELKLRDAKLALEELNNSLEFKIKDEISKNTKQQIMLMHQSKLAQMGEMIENIAHQWRQPLSQINSYVLLIDVALSNHKIKDNDLEDKLLEIESLTAYMSKTIDDFKNFFHPNKQKSTFRVKEAIEKSYDIVKGLIKSQHIKVNLDIEDSLKTYSYLEELQQVILILLSNAIEALILMKIKSPEIFVKTYQKDEEIFICIGDNALGIKDENIEKIFEPYFTTKHKSQGTGLGLYMAKMIIENAIGGKLNVQNKLNGAYFTIQIPITKE